VVGLGPGSSARDYRSVRVPFEERWARFDEAVVAVCALLRGASHDGRFYPVAGPLEPLPSQPGGPPVWIGSWGSEAGLRRAVRLGDGWLASAYNTMPEQFRDSWRRVLQLHDELGRDPSGFANGLATMWFYIDSRRATEVFDGRLAPIMDRPAEQLRERLAFGPAEVVAEKLSAFRNVGVQRVFLWPVADEIEQLQRFSEEVVTELDEQRQVRWRSSRSH
jgi:alkanesulfonate monooxygenase SsuD/methylene tetrahydromethanopterin reductase-like flavin-dependent oxidoreductase (luciferase family)